MAARWPRRCGRRRRPLACIAALLAAGALPNLAQAMASLGRHDMLSGQAANVWWIVTYVMRAIYAVPDWGWLDAFIPPVRRPLAHLDNRRARLPESPASATLLAGGDGVGGLWLGRRARDLPRLALLGAWLCLRVLHALGAGAREPLLPDCCRCSPLAAAACPSGAAVLAAEPSVRAEPEPVLRAWEIGVGYAVPQNSPASTPPCGSSLANVALFVWFARLSRRSDPPRRRPHSSPRR